jgi:hypothetical protein
MTLGISPGVSSCTDPVAAAICWPRTLSSLRKAIAECICYLLLVQVMDDDGAALERHESNLKNSLFVRL